MKLRTQTYSTEMITGEPMQPIELDHSAQNFIDQVEDLSHSHLSRCWHCLTCSGGCPFSEDMDYMPNTIIRMIQFGLDLMPSKVRDRESIRNLFKQNQTGR